MKIDNCAKCGAENYQLPYGEPHRVVYRPETQILKEQIQVTCWRCGYSWRMDCIDKEV